MRMKPLPPTRVPSCAFDKKWQSRLVWALYCDITGLRGGHVIRKLAIVASIKSSPIRRLSYLLFRHPGRSGFAHLVASQQVGSNAGPAALGVSTTPFVSRLPVNCSEGANKLEHSGAKYR
jgi:hypothetical protein